MTCAPKCRSLFHYVYSIQYSTVRIINLFICGRCWPSFSLLVAAKSQLNYYEEIERLLLRGNRWPFLSSCMPNVLRLWKWRFINSNKRLCISSARVRHIKTLNLVNGKPGYLIWCVYANLLWLSNDCSMNIILRDKGMEMERIKFRCKGKLDRRWWLFLEFEFRI